MLQKRPQIKKQLKNLYKNGFTKSNLIAADGPTFLVMKKHMAFSDA